MMVAGNETSTRVIACCGNMVVVYGMERMSFEIMRVLRESGAEVHCVLNEWERHRIEPLAECLDVVVLDVFPPVTRETIKGIGVTDFR